MSLGCHASSVVTHIEASKDLAVGRVLQQDLLKGEDGGYELLGARGEGVGLAMFHAAQVVVVDDSFEDGIEPVEWYDPML